jgi:hypothetical protein
LAGLVLLVASVALAAVPPLRKEILQEHASLVIVGRIARVSTSAEPLGGGSENTVYHVEIEIADVEKGEAKLGDRVKADTWKPSKRPDGWAGPQGQNVEPQAGQLVRCYLSGSEKDSYTFLVPNGLELLKSPTTRH